jgi:TolA-binding protein
MMSRATRNAQLATIFALLALPAFAAPPSTCGARDDYGKALCLYQRRSFVEASAAFRVIVEKGEQDATTIRAMYFLARSEMKLGRFDDAATLLVRIYSLDPRFYAAWNCDFLLGECRRAMGKD